MALPFFYSEEINTGSNELVLNEETSKHMVQVLRMKCGDQLSLTDGNGSLFNAEIINDHKKKCVVKLLSAFFQPLPEKKTTIALSLLKNQNRFEWFLEKATEIGVREIIPLICERSGKEHFRIERMQGILTSAMLQSQQSWLPVLKEPKKLFDLMKEGAYSEKFIAHCDEDEGKVQLSTRKPFNNSIILIGPEGDFTKSEIEVAKLNNYLPVALGETRLRTETAGIVAATVMLQR